MFSPAPHLSGSNPFVLSPALTSAAGAWKVFQDRRLPGDRPAAQNQPSAPDLTNFTVAARVPQAPKRGIQFSIPFLTLHASDSDQDGIFVVTDSFSRVYGEGINPRVAIVDYFESLIDRFLYLQEHQVELGQGLRKDLDAMRHYIHLAR